jgi:hypothetical protein
MHLYILCRGVKHDLDRFISELSAKYLPFKYKGADSVVQVGVRPIQLYEVVFPKEHLSSMVKSLGGLEVQQSEHFLFKYFKWFRKILHIEPVGDIDVNAPIIPLYRANIDIIKLGIKQDKDFEDGTEYL